MMGVSLSGGSDGGGGITRGGDVGLLPTEHSCTVHCNQVYCVPVSVGEEEAGVEGVQVVMVAGWLRGGVGSVWRRNGPRQRQKWSLRQRQRQRHACTAS